MQMMNKRSGQIKSDVFIIVFVFILLIGLGIYAYTAPDPNDKAPTLDQALIACSGSDDYQCNENVKYFAKKGDAESTKVLLDHFYQVHQRALIITD
jgi:hypothetical protein